MEDNKLISVDNDFFKKMYVKPIQLTKTIKVGFNNLYPTCLKKALLLWEKKILFLERVSMDQNAQLQSVRADGLFHQHYNIYILYIICKIGHYLWFFLFVCIPGCMYCKKKQPVQLVAMLVVYLKERKKGL